MNLDLFESSAAELHGTSAAIAFAPGATWLRGFARPIAEQLIVGVEQVARDAPFRHMLTPGGRRMSVAMTNCGSVGWVSNSSGYRYDARDPDTDQPWPLMPSMFRELAAEAAEHAGFSAFIPDACLINRYEPGARLSLHQDKDERDFEAPIVSVSLGLPATFQFGGMRRADATERLALAHGDVVVWGGPARLRYHGVLPLEEGWHPLVGPFRVNLTFRKTQ